MNPVRFQLYVFSELQSRNRIKADSTVLIENGVRFYCPENNAGEYLIEIGANSIVRASATIYAGVRIGASCEIDHGVVIRENVVIGNRCHIHNGSDIGRNTELGDDNVILPHSVIMGNVRIGNANTLGPFITIGTDPQHPDFHHSDGVIEIGNSNVLREYVTVHMPTTDRVTRIGNDCYIMAYNHIPHDAVIQDHVKVANDCQIGGHTVIMHDAYLGLGCIIHQRSTIGPGTMIGMGSIIMKDIPPYVTLVEGVATKLNVRGSLLMKRTETEIADLLVWYKFQKNEEWNLEERLADCWWYSDMKEFLSKKRRKVCKVELNNMLD